MAEVAVGFSLSCLVMSCLATPCLARLVTPCLVSCHADIPRGDMCVDDRWARRGGLHLEARGGEYGAQCTFGRVMGGEYIIVSRNTVIAMIHNLPTLRILYSVLCSCHALRHHVVCSSSYTVHRTAGARAHSRVSSNLSMYSRPAAAAPATPNIEARCAGRLIPIRYLRYRNPTQPQPLQYKYVHVLGPIHLESTTAHLGTRPIPIPIPPPTALRKPVCRQSTFLFAKTPLHLP